MAMSGYMEPHFRPARHTVMRSLNLVPSTLIVALAVGCSAAPGDAGEQPAASKDDYSSLASNEAGRSEPPPAPQAPRTGVTLAVGHCFVEPLRVAGREWVTQKPYVGYGGGLPRGFTEDGRFVIKSATTAIFVAEGGAQIEFKVAPGQLRQRGCR